jgi:mRNA interferase HigB
MHVISRKRLREFGVKCPDAATPLDDWYRVMKAARFESPAEVKAAFRAASILSDREIVFNVAGNKYRIIVSFHYARGTAKGRVFVRHVFTHEEYDAWSDRRRRLKHRR